MIVSLVMGDVGKGLRVYRDDGGVLETHDVNVHANSGLLRIVGNWVIPT